MYRIIPIPEDMFVLNEVLSLNAQEFRVEG